MDTAIGDRLLAEQVRLVLRNSKATDWAVRAEDFWCHVQPPDYLPQEQGWKLHVSATPLSAMLVTLRAAEVLVRTGCAFKVPVGLPQLQQLVSANADRRSSGKVITAYPRDDEQFAALAEELHRATEHLPGPAILSDRPYRPGSLVHYRYGAFTGRRVLSNDGYLESMLTGPDGVLVKDERLPRFSPPPWAACPFEAGAPETAGPVLLAGRFEVHQAIRHGNKGGVYLAKDATTGDEVVIKQARPHVGALLDGTDTRDVLRHEAALLERLAPHGLTPRPVTLFEQQGHLFLVQERIAGSTLAAHVGERADGASKAGDPAGIGEAVALARQLHALIGTVHGEGLVIRDLTPANLMITPEGVLKLVDLEFIAVPAEPAQIIGTRGYAAPEQIGDDGPVGSLTGLAPAPRQTADLYSLGVLLFALTCGIDPGLVADRPQKRSIPQRLAHLVRMTARYNPATRALAPAILGLIAADPDGRWSLERVGEFLATAADDPGPALELPESDRLPQASQDALLADGLAWLAETFEAAAIEPLWPMGTQHAYSDPRNVQHGAGGVIALLVRASAVLGTPGLAGAPELADVARTASRWLIDRLSGRERLLPGLYFGTSGALWALHDTARLLADDELAARTLALARTIPVVWPNPDICHGAAGAGMVQLHLWQATGDEALAARVRECADGLLATVTRRDGGVYWPIPADFDSALAGLTHYGFAHGIAGIGSFLLAAGQATDHERYLRMAEAAGRTLAAAVTWDGDCAWWPVGEEADPSEPMRTPHWCSGSSGVGTFLIRLWRATGDDRYRELAEGAAHAVRDSRWQVTSSYCHGLAGDGQFLLDLADLLGEPRYHAWAEELATCLHARAVYRDGRLVVPDPSGEVTAGYGTGLAGVLSFLLRLRHGGPRPWMI
jgi:tRNA A-37 threonylcarbamoyl transferase component Bud32